MLRKYETAPDEKPMSRQMIDAIVRVAEKTVDEISNAEGLEVQLEEDYELQLPFILVCFFAHQSLIENVVFLKKHYRLISAQGWVQL